MYDNIGDKLKVVAIFQMVAGSVSGIGCGIWLITKSGFEVLGIILLIFSPIVSWINSLITYGIGEAATQHDYIISASSSRSNEDWKSGKGKSMFHGEDPVCVVEEHPQWEENAVQKLDRLFSRFNGNPVKVVVNEHNECRCPVCKKTVVFESSFCAQKCEHCKTNLKPVNH